MTVSTFEFKPQLNNQERRDFSRLIRRYFNINEDLSSEDLQVKNFDGFIELVDSDKSMIYGYLFFHTKGSYDYEANMNKMLRYYETPSIKVNYIFVDRENSIAGFHWRRRNG